MVDLAITASQVLPGLDSAGATFENGTAAVAVTAGQAVYLDTSTGTYKLADNNSTSPEAIVRGIALHAASAGQPLRIQTGGPLTLGAGAAPVVARPYVLSGTPGAIAPVADLATGMRTTILGVGGATNTLILRVWSTQQVAP
jgi:hypothetical protein